MTPEEYAKKHKAAFRTAFDFLNRHFPPGTDPEWWTQACADVSKENDLADNNLATELLLAVYNYLEVEYKERRKADGIDD